MSIGGQKMKTRLHTLLFRLIVVLFAVAAPTFAGGGPEISHVNMYPREFSSITASVGEIIPISIDVVLRDNQHLYDLTRVPVAFRSDGGARNEMFCVKAQGICVVRGLELGTTQFTVTPADGGWGYSWITINFVPPNVSSAAGILGSSVDKLPVTFNTNQVVTGDTVTAAVTFPKSLDGQQFLSVWVDGRYKSFFYPDGIKQGARQVILEKRIAPLENQRIAVTAELKRVPGETLVARGWGELLPGKNININLDPDTQTLKITDPWGSRDLEYRVFITQGEKFLLELPVRRFDLARGTELVFFDGMYGSNLAITNGRYTVTVAIRDLKYGGEYSRTETNGLVLSDTLRWH